MKNCSTDVLIVGAGPTGLFLSNLPEALSSSAQMKEQNMKV